MDQAFNEFTAIKGLRVVQQMAKDRWGRYPTHIYFTDEHQPPLVLYLKTCYAAEDFEQKVSNWGTENYALGDPKANVVYLVGKTLCESVFFEAACGLGQRVWSDSGYLHMLDDKGKTYTIGM